MILLTLFYHHSFTSKIISLVPKKKEVPFSYCFHCLPPIEIKVYKAYSCWQPFSFSFHFFYIKTKIYWYHLAKLPYIYIHVKISLKYRSTLYLWQKNYQFTELILFHLKDYFWHHRTLMKGLTKKLDGNSTRMLHAFLNKSWKRHLTKQQFYSYFSFRNPSKLDAQNKLGSAGEVGTNL